MGRGSSRLYKRLSENEEVMWKLLSKQRPAAYKVRCSWLEGLPGEQLRLSHGRRRARYLGALPGTRTAQSGAAAGELG